MKIWGISHHLRHISLWQCIGCFYIMHKPSNLRGVMGISRCEWDSPHRGIWTRWVLECATRIWMVVWRHLQEEYVNKFWRNSFQGYELDVRSRVRLFATLALNDVVRERHDVCFIARKARKPCVRRIMVYWDNAFLIVPLVPYPWSSDEYAHVTIMRRILVRITSRT